MFRKIALTLVLAVAILVALGVVKWRQATVAVAEMVSSAEASRAGQKSEHETVATPRYAASNSSGRLALSSEIRLPPPNTPLREIINQLKQRGEQGDPYASCRLATELMRCEVLPPRLQSLERMQAKLNGLVVGSEEHLQLSWDVSRFTKKRNIDQHVCANFENTAKLESWRYLFLAALGGHVPSMAQFAALPPFNPATGNLSLEGLAAYNRYATSFLMAAADAGDRGAVLDLADAYAGNSLFLNGQLGMNSLISVDPFLAAVYAHAYIPAAQSEQNMKNKLIEQLSKQVSPERMQSAVFQAQALQAAWSKDIQEKSQIQTEQRSSTEIRSFDKICDQK
jgi:hypothetical protein